MSKDSASPAPVRWFVNGREHQGIKGEGLLSALRRLGYRVPSLCHHEAVTPYGACRLCLVEVQKGRKRKLTTACNYPLDDQVQVFLDTPAVERHRRVVLELLLAEAPAAPIVRELASEHGVAATPYPANHGNDCILCGLCTRVCAEVVGVEAIAFSGRGTNRKVATPFDAESEACLACAACVEVCPTGRLKILEEEGRRRLPDWKRDVELAHCVRCGRVTAPMPVLEHIARRTGMEMQELATCVDCRGATPSVPVSATASPG